ncbi:LLM class flavin-dependent oxidoreductase [Kitasatospora sp. NPDC049285]|uniref:LLM class flavin-dependent oxidoreductase n=1 Tax=Kitasatospora sp. NPDC049285 TaxID=3157096 RepID=UPI0034388AF3
MTAPPAAPELQVYSVTPESTSPRQEFREDFRTRLAATAAASEQAGWAGILVPHNLHEVDPWIVAAHLGSVTSSLVPLLALQPACTPPHTAAACAAAYAMLYGRPLHFNLVTGARGDEMNRIGDELTHDQRYQRLLRYALVLKALLRGESVDEDSEYYRYRGLRLEPRPEVLEQCRFFVAGSSPASLAVAREVADVVVTHPVPYPQWRQDFLDPLRDSGYTGEVGIRIGVLAREDPAEAWREAHRRFPETWTGRQETLLKTRSQNAWSRELAVRAVDDEAAAAADPYWLGAFRSGLASAPFLVGGYQEVAERLGEYTAAGAGHILLNGGTDDDFPHVRRALPTGAGPAVAEPRRGGARA